MNIPDLGPCANAVLQLAECIPNFKNHKLYFDNWFADLPLIEHLAIRGIWCCAIVQPLRLPNLAFKTDRQLTAQGRGSYDEWETQTGSIKLRAVKWMDKRALHFVSSFLDSFPTGKCERYDQELKEKVEIPRPNIVKQYNNYIEGVDICDQLISYYRMNVKSKKGYHKLIFHLIEVTIINSWMLYRREARTLNVSPEMPLHVFRFEIANSLMKSGKTVPIERWCPSFSVESSFEAKKKNGSATMPIPNAATRGDGVGHFPAVSVKRAKCKLPGCIGRVQMYCIKCKVNLCCDSKRNCFLIFHTR